MARAFKLEPEGSLDTGPCYCCGNISRSVWGSARLDGSPFARYSVHWTVGLVAKHGANFDLIVGRWGVGSTASDRCAVGLAFRLIKSKPQFIVIDASNRDVARNHLAGRALAPAEVVGHPLAQDIFALRDAILMNDARVAEILGGRTDSEHE
jgi:hypothetical protein